MPKSKKTKKKDDRMIADYFKHLNNYERKYDLEPFFSGNVALFMKFILLRI